MSAAAAAAAAAALPLAGFVAGVFLLGGFVKGVVGLGLPTVAMGLLGIVMAPAQAAALLVVPSLVTNLWQIGGTGLGRLLRRLAGLLLGVCAGTAAGAAWLAHGRPDPAWTGFALGAALVVYAGLGLARIEWRVAPRHERWLGPLIGFATGIVTAATGVFVVPAVPYLQALGLDKDELVRALGVSFLVSTIALGLVLGGSGELRLPVLAGSLLALVPALLGLALGQRWRARVQPAAFRRIFFLGLLALGAYLALRSGLRIA